MTEDLIEYPKISNKNNNPEPKSVYSTTMKNLYDNEFYGMFKSQIEGRTKNNYPIYLEKLSTRHQRQDLRNHRS